MIMENGDYCEGNWHENKLNGKGVCYQKDGTEIKRGIWKDGKF